MKRFPKSQAARAVALVLGVWCAFPALGQDQPVVHSRPGNRQMLPLPAANAQGVPLTLSQAVAIAVANNQDQYVTVNAAESFEYLIVQNKGIYDPLINAAVNRSHSEIPAASQLTGGIFDDTSFSAGVSQFTP